MKLIRGAKTNLEAFGENKGMERDCRDMHTKSEKREMRVEGRKLKVDSAKSRGEVALIIFIRGSSTSHKLKRGAKTNLEDPSERTTKDGNGDCRDTQRGKTKLMRVGGRK